MSFLQSRLYSQLIQFSNHIFLSVLWVVCCLPLITIVPATISLYAVVRAWKKEENEGILYLFFTEMKENMIQKIMMSLALLLFIFVFYLNLMLMLTNEVSLLPIVLLCNSLILFVCLSVHFCNIYVRSKEKKILTIFKNTLMLVVTQLPWTFIGLITIGLVCLLVLVLPLIIFIIGSLLAYLLILISDKALDKINIKQQMIKNI